MGRNVCFTQTTAADIANILMNEIICRYGIPLYILSDNGPQFASQLFNDIWASLGTQHKFTANYHPQTKMTERVNRTLKAQLAIYIECHPSLWDNKIPKLAFAIRTSVNETTGDTPAYLNFGRDPLIPLNLMFHRPIIGLPPTTSEHRYIHHYRTNLMQNLRAAYSLVREHSQIKKLRQKKHITTRTHQAENLSLVT